MTADNSDEHASYGPCPCCGADMIPERKLKYSILIRCRKCGISDTRVR